MVVVVFTVIRVLSDGWAQLNAGQGVVSYQPAPPRSMHALEREGVGKIQKHCFPNPILATLQGHGLCSTLVRCLAAW